MNLKALTEGIKRRDMDSFHDLYTSHMPVLHAFANRYTFDHETSRDLVHDVFLWLWEHPDKIDSDRNVVHLLRVMVRNSCLNYLRKLRIEDKHSDKLVEAILLSSEHYWLDDPDDLDIELRRQIRRVLDKLPERQRSILSSHFVEGMQIKDVALLHGVAESTVKTHLKRAVKTIRTHFPAIVIILTFTE